MDNSPAVSPPSGPGVVEVAPRDGLQNESRALSPQERAVLIERAVRAGARRVEAVAFVHPGRVPQMAGAEEVMALLTRPDGVRYSGLVLNTRGMERASESGVHEINYALVASDTFSRRNQGVGTEESMRTWEQVSALAHREGIGRSLTIAAAFGCPFEGEIAESRVLELVRRGVTTGAEEIVLADTIGVGAPDVVTRLLEAVRAEAPDVALRCHFHNTRNTGYANAVAAAATGAAWLDSSLGGIGGCPFAPAATGNIATEDLVYLLHRMGMDTGIDLESAAATGTWLGEVLGISVPALLGRSDPFPGTVGGEGQ
ncbi:hydroxymethylglutaryl-CoA lyase [Streptomyces sp. NPDC058701]|uniref:hydroxymethylglutaryl-CoA lyase n=1 Tax=Streptomyces sp. NPDC058701 TaxID=3346608 RepID=UPI003656C295